MLEDRSNFENQELLYENPLQSEADTEDFVIEGEGLASFPRDRLRLESRYGYPSNEDVYPHFLCWCPETFPDEIAVSWDFYPIHEPGLAMFWFAARGQNGEHVLDDSLSERNGRYGEDYGDSDINALHTSYFRRNTDVKTSNMSEERFGYYEREFQTVNLRKSKGLNPVMWGGDPIPGVAQANPPYRIRVVKYGPDVVFSVEDLEVYRWSDDGETHGPVLEGGSIGFRQMAPLIAEYADLKVHSVEKVE
ncbi:YesU family protein [Halocatena marina]|nr:YesU family protein [Halocatena marina]